MDDELQTKIIASLKKTALSQLQKPDTFSILLDSIPKEYENLCELYPQIAHKFEFIFCLFLFYCLERKGECNLILTLNP